jgi:putative membrane protein
MDAILQALQTGLPVLVMQFAVTLALLAIGVALYMTVTPFHELRLVRGGNVAAGLAFAGALVGLAIPLAATLATSLLTLDILVWGAVAIVVQILAFLLASRLVGGMREMIEANNAAGACVLVGVQLAVALLNAAAMSG